MSNLALITITASIDDPVYEWARRQLVQIARIESLQRRVNAECQGIDYMPPSPKYQKIKIPFTYATVNIFARNFIKSIVP